MLPGGHCPGSSALPRAPPRKQKAGPRGPGGPAMALPLPVVEAALFQCFEAYVYALPPNTSSLGHRAETWDVENWMQEVAVRVVERGDECFALLETKAEEGSGQPRELFAACPVPPEGPLSVAVDAVVDSSRYFVLRVEDISAPKEQRKHAFIGVGFRERDAASDFMAALQTCVLTGRSRREVASVCRGARALTHGLAFRTHTKFNPGSAGDTGARSRLRRWRLRSTRRAQLGRTTVRVGSQRLRIRRITASTRARP